LGTHDARDPNNARIISPGAVSLTRQPAPGASKSRNRRASSSKLNTVTASSPPASTVSASVKQISSRFAISQYDVGCAPDFLSLNAPPSVVVRRRRYGALRVRLPVSEPIPRTG